MSFREGDIANAIISYIYRSNGRTPTGEMETAFDDDLGRYEGGIRRLSVEYGYVAIDGGDVVLTEPGRRYAEQYVIGPEEHFAHLQHAVHELDPDAEVGMDRDTGTISIIVSARSRIDPPTLYGFKRFFEGRFGGDWQIRTGIVTEDGTRPRKVSALELSAHNLGHFMLHGVVKSVGNRMLDDVEGASGPYREVKLIELPEDYDAEDREPLEVDLLSPDGRGLIVGRKVEIVIHRATATTVPWMINEVHRVDDISQWARASRDIIDAYDSLINSMIRNPDGSIRFTTYELNVRGDSFLLPVPVAMEIMDQLTINKAVAHPFPMRITTVIAIVPESWHKMMLFADGDVGKTWLAESLGTQLSEVGLRVKKYDMSSTSRAGSLGGRGDKDIVKGTALLNDINFFDEWQFAPKDFKDKLREPMSEHKISVNFQGSGGRSMIDGVDEIYLKPTILMANAKDGEHLTKARSAGKNVVLVPFSDDLKKIIDPPLQTRISSIIAMSSTDRKLWDDEVRHRQIVTETVGIGLGNGVPDLLKAWLYRMGESDPPLDSGAIAATRGFAGRKFKNIVWIARAIARMCLSETITQECIECAAGLVRWADATVRRTFDWALDLDGNIFKLDEQIVAILLEEILEEKKSEKEENYAKVLDKTLEWLQYHDGVPPSEKDIPRMLSIDQGKLRDLKVELSADWIWFKVKGGKVYYLPADGEVVSMVRWAKFSATQDDVNYVYAELRKMRGDDVETPGVTNTVIDSIIRSRKGSKKGNRDADNGSGTGKKRMLCQSCYDEADCSLVGGTYLCDKCSSSDGGV